LWIGTEEGLNRYDFATGRFVHYTVSPPVYSFFEDRNRRIWVASPAGPGWIDTLQQKIVLPHQEQNVNLYWEDSSLRLWMGVSGEQGLAVHRNDHSTRIFIFN
jgi:ligand-binding sensor domain-containing protein